MEAQLDFLNLFKSVTHSYFTNKSRILISKHKSSPGIVSHTSGKLREGSEGVLFPSDGEGVSGVFMKIY